MEHVKMERASVRQHGLVLIVPFQTAKMAVLTESVKSEAFACVSLVIMEPIVPFLVICIILG